MVARTMSIIPGTPNPVNTTVMTITPDMARQWLEANTHNRPIRQATVDIYAASMRAGRWRLNGEAITFDTEGRLANGQHRLWACIEADTSFQAVVVTNIEPDAFLTIDQGAKRSGADALFIEHKEATTGVNRATVAAAAVLVWQYRNNQIFGNSRLPASDLVRLVAEEPTLIEWCREARRAPKLLKGFATPVAATMHVGSKHYAHKAGEFVQRFIDGVGLAQGSPILSMRNRMISNPPHRAWERFYLVVQTWNAFAQDRQLHRIPLNPGIEAFPKIKGE